MLEAITALWSGEHVSYQGRYYRFERPPHRAAAGPAAASADLDRGRHAAVRADLRPAGRHRAAGPRADRAVRGRVGPALLRDRRDGRAATGTIVQEAMLRLGREPDDDVARVLELRPRPRARRVARVAPRRGSGGFSGMDLDYWQEFYLLGEAEPLAERIRGKIEALGGVDEVILNPLDWDVRALERLATRRPAAPRRGVGSRRCPPTSRRPGSTTRSTRSAAGRHDRRRGRDGPLPGTRRSRTGARTSSTSRASPTSGRSAADERAGGSRPLTTWTDIREAALPPLFDGLKEAAAHDRRRPDPEPRHDRRERGERLAGGRRHADASWRSTRSVELASVRGRRRVPVGRVRDGQPADGPGARRARHGHPRAGPGRRRAQRVREARRADVARHLDRHGRGRHRGRVPMAGSSTRASRSAPARRSRAG